MYHLSAQFPGPTTPRDFVTLLITSSSALGDFKSTQPSSSMSTDNCRSSHLDRSPRHFLVISKPCIHPDCPPRDGFIRGQYESVEFIREIPQKIKKTSSTTQLLKPERARPNSSSLDRAARLRSAREKLDQGEKGFSGADATQADDCLPTPSTEDLVSGGGRRRGRTISFAESRGFSAKGEAMDTCQDDLDDLDETNPVEWIMVTRSDPGGSVPRFLVERGTPSGIVADAGKFLDWAMKKELPNTEDNLAEVEETIDSVHVPQQEHQGLEAYQTNGHLVGLSYTEDEGVISKTESTPIVEELPAMVESKDPEQNQHGGLLASVANLAYTGIESYAPQILIDHLPGHQHSSSVSVKEPSIATSVTTGSEAAIPNGATPSKSRDETSSILSASSIASFASAEDHFETTLSRQTTSSLTKSPNEKGAADMSHDKELAKLGERKKALDDKLAKIREKETKDKEELTSKEEERLRKAEEKHAREVQKQEEKYKKEVAKLEAKRVKDAAKEEERKRKAEDKVERTRLIREKDETRQQLEVVLKERDILKEQVGALQKENTALVAKMGKTAEGLDLLRDVRAEVVGGTRSRSGSLRKMKPASSVTEIEGTSGGK